MVEPKNQPGSAEALKNYPRYIIAVDFDQFSLYSTGAMIIYDRLSL